MIIINYTLCMYYRTFLKATACAAPEGLVLLVLLLISPSSGYSLYDSPTCDNLNAAIAPMICKIKEGAIPSWYADNASASATLPHIHRWSDKL